MEKPMEKSLVSFPFTHETGFKNVERVNQFAFYTTHVSLTIKNVLKELYGDVLGNAWFIKPI